MSLRFEPVTKSSKDIHEIKGTFRESFPVHERLPMWFLLWKSKRDFIDFLGVYDEDKLIGYTYLITNDNLTFVLYLTIDSKIRSKGYGGLVLSKIKEHFPNNRIILNIEAVEETAANYEQRLQRKRFYMRNGYRRTNFNILDAGNAYEVLVCGKDVTIEEYRDLIQRFSGPVLSIFVKPVFYLS